MTFEETDYLRRREAQERAAAKRASTLAARRAHQQLAERYAALLDGLGLYDPVISLRREGLL